MQCDDDDDGEAMSSIESQIDLTICGLSQYLEDPEVESLQRKNSVEIKDPRAALIGKLFINKQDAILTDMIVKLWKG